MKVSDRFDSSFILHPSSFILPPSSFILPPSSFAPAGVFVAEIQLRGDNASQDEKELLLILRAVELSAGNAVDLRPQRAQAGPKLIAFRDLLETLGVHRAIVATDRTGQQGQKGLTTTLPMTNDEARMTKNDDARMTKIRFPASTFGHSFVIRASSFVIGQAALAATAS